MTESQATPLNNTLIRYKKFIGNYEKLSDFKQPVLWLAHNNGTITTYENATSGTFKYKHADGTERTIHLHPKYLQNFPYAGTTFKVYWCHEDYPTPIPENPIISSEIWTSYSEKLMADLHKWKTQQTTAIGDAAFKILAGIALIGGVGVLYKLLVPPTPTTNNNPAVIIVSNQTNPTKLSTIIPIYLISEMRKYIQIIR